METIALIATTREPWNKGKLVGQKTPFKLKEIWAIRVRLLLTSSDSQSFDKVMVDVYNTHDAESRANQASTGG